MAAGYLIRNESEQIKGYALEGEGQILVRMYGGEGTAYVAACGMDGERVFEVPYDGKEHVFEWTLGKTERIEIRHHEERIVNKKEEMDARIEEEKGNFQVLCKKHARRCVYKGKRVMERSACMTRWPPPPCWPTARYVEGVWREGGD